MLKLAHICNHFYLHLQENLIGLDIVLFRYQNSKEYHIISKYLDWFGNIVIKNARIHIDQIHGCLLSLTSCLYYDIYQGNQLRSHIHSQFIFDLVETYQKWSKVCRACIYATQSESRHSQCENIEQTNKNSSTKTIFS